MIIWSIAQVVATEEEIVNSYLVRGYEPFAVVMNRYGFPVIWMKKGVENEVRTEPTKPVKGTGTRVNKRAKAKDKS